MPADIVLQGNAQEEFKKIKDEFILHCKSVICLYENIDKDKLTDEIMEQYDIQLITPDDFTNRFIFVHVTETKQRVLAELLIQFNNEELNFWIVNYINYNARGLH